MESLDYKLRLPTGAKIFEQAMDLALGKDLIKTPQFSKLLAIVKKLSVDHLLIGRSYMFSETRQSTVFFGYFLALCTQRQLG